LLQLSGIEDILSAVLGRRGIEERDPLRVVARQSTLRYVRAKADINIDSLNREPEGAPAAVRCGG